MFKFGWVIWIAVLFLPWRLPAECSYYLWQRDYNAAVLAAAQTALADENITEVFGLAAELCVLPSGKWQWVKAAVPEEISAHHKFVPVYRVTAKALPDAGRLAQELQEITANVPHFQLDVDAPESKLAAYGAVLQSLKANGKKFSVTLLPVHLKHDEFMQCIENCAEYYVLQLHGLNVPQSIDDEYFLMNPATVKSSMEQALKRQIPFKAALPSYAYVLEFDEQGKFVRLYAEGADLSVVPHGHTLRLAAAEPKQLVAFLTDYPTVERIWFRLPTAESRWSYSGETMAEIERKIVPEMQLEWRTERKGRRLTLFLTLKHQISLTEKTVNIVWRTTLATGEFFPSAKVKCAAATPIGRLPEQLSIAFGADGQEVAVANFITDAEIIMVK